MNSLHCTFHQLQPIEVEIFSPKAKYQVIKLADIESEMCGRVTCKTASTGFVGKSLLFPLYLFQTNPCADPPDIICIPI